MLKKSSQPLMSFKDIMLESYKASAVRHVRPHVPNVDPQRIEEFMMGVFVMHTLLMWRVSSFIATQFPRSVAAVRSLILSALCVILFWLIYLF